MRSFAAAFSCVLFYCAMAFGQAREGLLREPRATNPELVAGQVVGANNFIHSVMDMNKAVEFYRDVLGLELKTTPGRPVGIPAPSRLNEALSNLTATHAANFRAVAFKVPDAGFDLELTEFTGIERKAGQARNQDPGSATLV